MHFSKHSVCFKFNFPAEKKNVLLQINKQNHVYLLFAYIFVHGNLNCEQHFKSFILFQMYGKFGLAMLKSFQNTQKSE